MSGIGTPRDAFILPPPSCRWSKLRGSEWIEYRVCDLGFFCDCLHVELLKVRIGSLKMTSEIFVNAVCILGWEIGIHHDEYGPIDDPHRGSNLPVEWQFERGGTISCAGCIG